MDTSSQKYIMVTGGAGFIGSTICRELVKQGEYTPIAVDLFVQYVGPRKDPRTANRYKRFEDIADRVVIKRANCANYAVMYDIIEHYLPEYIIHLAALPIARMEDTTPDDFKEGTVDATANLMHIVYALKQKGHDLCKKFIYTSSSMVYGHFMEDPVSEKHPKDPINVYGTMKLAGEIVTRGLGNTYGIPYIIIRPSAVYGPTDMNYRVSQIFVENALKGKELTVRGRKDRLDFSYVTDVARGMVQATLSDCINEDFNITAGNARSILNFAEILKENFPDLTIHVVDREKESPQRGGLDIGKAQRMFGYSPEFTLERGINEYVAYLKTQLLQRQGDSHEDTAV